LIWALSQLADRALPIIIDTPLGRLDTIHRKKKKLLREKGAIEANTFEEI